MHFERSVLVARDGAVKEAEGKMLKEMKKRGDAKEVSVYGSTAVSLAQEMVAQQRGQKRAAPEAAASEQERKRPAAATATTTTAAPTTIWFDKASNEGIDWGAQEEGEEETDLDPPGVAQAGPTATGRPDRQSEGETDINIPVTLAILNYKMPCWLHR